MRRIALLVVSLAATLPFSLLAQGSDSAPCLMRNGKAIPVIERPGTGSDGPLAVLLTGDGGWANADQKLTDGLIARGAAVVGVNMRAYLSDGRTPDETARDLACIARRYGALWRRDRLLLIGYSRGADIAPFVAARWPADLRARLSMVALVSMSMRANFKYHFLDLVRDVDRPDDLDIAPEIARLRGLTVICVYGADDEHSGCPTADSTIVTRYPRLGGHRVSEGFDAIIDLLTPALPAVTR
ncbi:MAG: AcvB/VirJ family lysyl-phosphatidylglycerol hydrolase [Gemmatimonadota bacterium]